MATVAMLMIFWAYLITFKYFATIALSCLRWYYTCIFYTVETGYNFFNLEDSRTVSP